jgi:hypothetical protein
MFICGFFPVALRMTLPLVTLNEVKGLNVRFFAALRMTLPLVTLNEVKGLNVRFFAALRMTGSEGLSAT